MSSISRDADLRGGQKPAHRSFALPCRGGARRLELDRIRDRKRSPGRYDGAFARGAAGRRRRHRRAAPPQVTPIGRRCRSRGTTASFFSSVFLWARSSPRWLQEHFASKSCRDSGASASAPRSSSALAGPSSAARRSCTEPGWRAVARAGTASRGECSSRCRVGLSRCDVRERARRLRPDVRSAEQKGARQ